jgi:hypothetical protein
MKKRRGKRWGLNWSVIQPEQQEFFELINDCWLESYIAHGFEEAKSILDSYL